MNDEYFKNLEKRIERIEEFLELGEYKPKKSTSDDLPEQEKSESLSLEVRIGEYWLARIGVIVLVVGAAFFISYPFQNLSPIFSSLFGYLAVAFLYGLSFYWKRSAAYLSNMLLGSSIVLFYYATLRLHLFNQNPVIHNKFIGHAVLVIVVFYLFFYTIKKQKQGFMVIALLLSYFTALSSSIPHFTLSLLVISSGMAGYIYLQKNWDMILLLGLVLTYLSHLIWFFNNPILGQPIQAVALHHYNLIYLVLYSTLFGTIIAFSKKSREGEFFNILSSLMNSAGIIFIGALNILTFFKGSVSLLACCTFLYFFFLASFNWIKTLNYYTTSIYSCFAHITLSVSILSYFQYPDYFIWLSIQSYLAILTALWFRSKIIVIANIFIYMGIYLFYLIFSASHNWINFSYALTALLSARTLNWKKQRLNIKTELIRNTYLLCAFVVVLYGLEKGVTGPFVSISWLGASLFYFITSILLKNIKYRWMAILTIFATVIRVFLIDTSKLDPGYRIILFVITGGIILVLSLIYKKYEKSIKSDKT